MAKRIDYREFMESKFNWFVITFLVIKIILMALFSSDYQNKLFLPFVIDFVKNGWNPYQRAFELGVTNAFPYPPVMLFIESIGAFIINAFGISNVLIRNLVFKLPSLIIDIIGLNILVKMYSSKRRYIAVFYWASPIIIYSVYMHGQLDIIPMIMLMISLYYFTAKKDTIYNDLIGTFCFIISVLCKFHILAVFPILLLYLVKKDGHIKGFYFGIASLLGCVLGILPFISEGFIKTVLMNSEQSVLTEVSFDFSTVSLYIPIFAVCLVYLLTFKSSYINRELCLNLCGVVFSVFLAFCPPMPGWYVWIVPFMALFFASINEEKYKNIALFALLNAFYLVYFIFLHARQYVDLYFIDCSLQYIKIDSILLKNGLFTLLSCILIYLIVSMYMLGIASNNFYKRKNVPFTIGIAGDSGAGKSTMIDVIERCMGASNLLYIEGDGDHKWERGAKYWDEYTALNPKANYLYRQANDLKELREGSAIRRVDYDHSTGKFTKAKRVKSKKYVILCGLHALYLPQTRRNLDLKIYMDSDEVLRRFWKIQRDTTKRGHSKEKVLKSIEERMPDAIKYIYPQKEYADFIVHYYDKTLTDCMANDHEVTLSIKLSISAAIEIDPLIQILNNNGINIEYNYSDDLKHQIVTIDAENMERQNLPVEKIAEDVIPQLDELTRENLSSEINIKDGVIILFLLLVISNKMQGIS